MKKIFLLLMIFILVGCTKEEEKVIITPTPENIEPTPTPYIDNNPITVGIYYKGKLIHEYNTKFQNKKDIAIFNIYFTNKEDLGSTNVKNNYNKYYQEYENIKEYKTGFLISFDTVNGHMENLLLDPSNQHKLHPYLYAYLYDATHQTGKYSHLKKEDINNDTNYTSIKLYLHLDTKEITSPITLTVFTYKDENDFLDGHYRGNSSYTITINNK